MEATASTGVSNSQEVVFHSRNSSNATLSSYILEDPTGNIEISAESGNVYIGGYPIVQTVSTIAPGNLAVGFGGYKIEDSGIAVSNVVTTTTINNTTLPISATTIAASNGYPGPTDASVGYAMRTQDAVGQIVLDNGCYGYDHCWIESWQPGVSGARILNINTKYGGVVNIGGAGGVKISNGTALESPCLADGTGCPSLNNTIQGGIILTTATSDSTTLTYSSAYNAASCVFSPTDSTATLLTILPYLTSLATTGSVSVTINHAATVGNGATYNIVCSIWHST
jgi:hypothetical protein